MFSTRSWAAFADWFGQGLGFRLWGVDSVSTVADHPQQAKNGVFFLCFDFSFVEHL